MPLSEQGPLIPPVALQGVYFILTFQMRNNRLKGRRQGLAEEMGDGGS